MEEDRPAMSTSDPVPRLRTRWGARALLLAAVVAGAATVTWQLWEQDAFWQVRAGHELWATWRWPTTDTWSYTSAGGSWRNFQWLSTLIMAAADRLGGVAGLVLLRAALVAAILGVVLWLCRRRGASALQAVALAGLLWLACARRFQVRSDLFVTLVFAVVLATAETVWSWRIRRAVLVVLVVLAANLHPGTAPFVQLAALAVVLQDEHPDRPSHGIEALFLAAILLGLLATPYHLHVLPYLWRHLFYGAYQAVPNPDHRSLALADFLPSNGGLGPMAWLALVLAAVLLTLAKMRTAGQAAQRRLLPGFLLLVLLAGLSVNRDRVMPYAATVAAVSLAGRLPAGGAARWRGALAALAAALIWLVAVPLWLSRPEIRFGFGPNPHLHPVGAARFLAAQRPEREILHFQGDGNYLLQALPDYRVFLDTRESMYEPLQRVYRDMVNDPVLMAAVMARYHVSTVLVPEAFLLTPWQDRVSRRAAFFPKRDFALVYFDEDYAVLVRRIPAHERLIAAHEYELLLPYRDPRAYLSTQDRTPERDRAFHAEVERCLREVPGFSYCQQAKAALAGR